MAQQWKVLEEESITLEYRNAEDTASILAISCSDSRSDIVVPLNPGVKPPDRPIRLTMVTSGRAETTDLEADVCKNNECTDRPNGDVSVYQVVQRGKQLALKAATVKEFKLDAPGATFSIAAAQRPFDDFVRLCRRQ
jgi:hypothetical protein